MERLKTIALRIAVVGMTGTFIAINSIPILLNRRIRESEHYKQALDLLSSHPEAVKWLGEPITAQKVTVTNEEHYGSDDERMWLKVPVKGPNGTGLLSYNFFLNQYGSDSFKLSQVELTLDKFKDRMLIIKSE